MKSPPRPPDLTTTPDVAGLKLLIVYDDRGSGFRGKQFADRLVQAHDCPRRCEDSLWRSEMLEFPTLASEADSAANGSDFLILSLSKGTVPSGLRYWLESVLAKREEEDTAVVVLFDPTRSDRRTQEGARHFFRALCAEHGVAFFSHVPGGQTQRTREGNGSNEADSAVEAAQA